jgi:hypothetical protein
VNRSPLLGFVGIASVAASIGMIAALFVMPIPESNRDLLNIAAGVLLGWGGNVVSFYFGSSKSSRDKDARAAGEV